MAQDNTNIVGLLHQKAIQHPDKIAYAFLRDGITVGKSLTYGELDSKVREIASTLQSQGKSPGTRALLLYSSSEEFIPAFLGCLGAGVIAVPAPAIAASQLKRSLPRLKAIACDSQISLVLTSSQLSEKLGSIEQKIIPGVDWQLLETDFISAQTAESWQSVTWSENSLAFIQYTSGSTTEPKGVMVSHRNLWQNLTDMAQELGYTEDSVVATWVPYFHDLGLVKGLLEPLYMGITCYIMSPLSFMKRPLRWLEVISHYQVTHSDAPSSAYDFCVERITSKQIANLDLSHWSHAGISAEPIQKLTIERFTKAFSLYGFKSSAFCCGYGLAETTLCCTATPQSEKPNFLNVCPEALGKNEIMPRSSSPAKAIASCGYPVGQTKLAIVNPETSIRVSDNQVGEIWIKSDSVAPGYFNQPEATQKIFQAHLLDTGEGSFLRTGDLGFIHHQELFITGRLKETMIIRGRNYYPQDIEITVSQSHDRLNSCRGAVFTIAIKTDHKLIVIQEVPKKQISKLILEEIIRDVRQAVVQQHNLQIHQILLVKNGTIPLTSSGKIQRNLCQKMFLDNQLNNLIVQSQASVN